MHEVITMRESYLANGEGVGLVVPWSLPAKIQFASGN